MALSSVTASLEEVAAALNRKPAWLKRHWLRIHQQHGFPRKIPTGDVWPRAAVEAWLRAGGHGEVPAHVAANGNEPDHDLVSAASSALADRYGGRA